MKSGKAILTAFFLNLGFSIFEFLGGVFTGSVAILSDAMHDLGDAVSIGLSYFLEKKSYRRPDEQYTYGYGRYSVIGGCITNLILLFGSVGMIAHSIGRMITPTEVHSGGMMGMAVIGLLVNGGAVFLTRGGDSLNQKAVNLHMLEDLLGWAVVLLGALAMQMTGFTLIDPILSIGLSLYILYHAARNLKEAVALFLEKVPVHDAVSRIKSAAEEVEGVLEAHHIHCWSLDGRNQLVTLHIVTDGPPQTVKEQVRHVLNHLGIQHVTIETETSKTPCCEPHCSITPTTHCNHSHHH